MNLGFRFRLVYRDEHLLKVRISAWNGAFGGMAEIYTDTVQLREAATTLQGFPLDPSDAREITFGEFGPKSAGGAVSMRFYCVDKAGHTSVDSKIESAFDSRADKAQSVVMTLAIQPAALDIFVEELPKLAANQTETAFLQGLTTELED
jgi:hypothetical protein